MRNCFPAFIFCVIQATSKSDGKFIWFLHHNFLQGIMGSPVVGSTDSCREHLRLSGVPTVVESTHSCPEYRKNLQLSGLPTAVESTFSYPKYPQLSRAPPLVQSTSSCREHLQLSRAPPVVESTSSCPKYLQLSRAPPVVQSISSCREHLQLSKVSPVVQSTSSCPKYLQLSITSPVIESTPSCRKYLHLSKAPPVVESDFCQTGSVIVWNSIRNPCRLRPNTFQTFETRGMTNRPGDNEITQKRGDIGSGTYREPVFSQTCSLFPKKMVPEDQS